MKYVEFARIAPYLVRTCLGFARLGASYLFGILKLLISKWYSEIVLTQKMKYFPSLEKIPGVSSCGKEGISSRLESDFPNGMWRRW